MSGQEFVEDQRKLELESISGKSKNIEIAALKTIDALRLAVKGYQIKMKIPPKLILEDCYAIVISLIEIKNLLIKKSDKCSMCNHTSELHDFFDEVGTYCLICERYE